MGTGLISESSKDPAEGRVRLVLFGAKGRMRLIKINGAEEAPSRGGRNAPLPGARIRRMMPARQSLGLGALPCFGVLGEGVIRA